MLDLVFFTKAFFLISILFHLSLCIEDYELDLYDLVEEVNGTFYEFMEIAEVGLISLSPPNPKHSGPDLNPANHSLFNFNH